ncbi:hypothetical protein [Bacillus cereus]|uniref:hypothetical protein n=1 Tax=Bacillus cereus TaxID=1396 RepID=UPI0007FB4772|nr:hypothetical protein [Bacillus cereus]OBW55700.1 hypothetical protein A9987_26115 [Bacillus cereus]
MKHEFNFSVEEVITGAKDLGLKVKINSNTPGVYLEKNGEKVEIKSEDLFSDLAPENFRDKIKIPKVRLTTKKFSLRINEKEDVWENDLVGAA